MRNPLDPFSEVVDERRHWDQEWYSWLAEFALTATQLQASVATLQSSVAALQSSVTALQSSVTTLQATSPPGLVFIRNQTVTTPVAAIDFTGLTSAYDAYVFEGTNLNVSVTGAGIFLRASIDNGASYISTGNYWTDIVFHYQASPTPSAANAGTSPNSIYHQITHGLQTNPAHFSLTFYRASATFPHFLSQSGNWHPGNGIMYVASSGIASVGGIVNALRFLPHSGGNITSGSITLYGMRKT